MSQVSLHPINMLTEAIPDLKGQVWSLPCGHFNRTYPPLSTVILHLNDTERWSREQIADWLETLDLDLSFLSHKGSK